MKKILGLGRKKNGRQSPSRSRVVSCASAPGALICSGGDGYNLQTKDLNKLHRAAAEGDLGELRHLLQKHDLNEQDKAGRWEGAGLGSTPASSSCKYQLSSSFLLDYLGHPLSLHGLRRVGFPPVRPVTGPKHAHVEDCVDVIGSWAAGNLFLRVPSSESGAGGCCGIEVSLSTSSLCGKVTL